MKIILKHNNLYAIALNANFDKNRIIGELHLFDFFKKEIPTGKDFHIHFIYFSDGNYHFSIKYFDAIEQVYIDRKTYWNHISTYKSIYKDFKFRSSEIRNRIEENMLDMFMMSEPLKPWNVNTIAHNFGVLAFNTNRPDHFEWSEKIKIKEKDIVIDLEKYPDELVNISACAYSENCSHAFDLSNSALTIIGEKTLNEANLYLKISAFIP